MASQPNTPVQVEYLYSIHSGYDANDNWIPTHVMKFKILKKTPKRIYYEPYVGALSAAYVNRQVIEAVGEVYQKSRHWSESDFHLYLRPPEIEQYDKPDLAALKAQMTAAHPDRGGTHQAFIAARAAYVRARGLEV